LLNYHNYFVSFYEDDMLPSFQGLLIIFPLFKYIRHRVEQDPCSKLIQE
jgi:hypothetical protein